MEQKVLVLTFEDEGQKEQRLAIPNVKEGVETAVVKEAANSILDAQVFSEKGKYVKVVKAQLVVTTTNVIFRN